MHGARQSRAMCNREKCQRAWTLWTASSKVTTNAISSTRYSAASRLYVLAGERIQIRSQPRHNIDQHIPEKSIPKSIKNRSKIDENRFLEPCWLKMTPPWSHLGPRWPRGSSFDRLLEWFGPSQMDLKSMKNRSSGSSWAKMAPRRCHLEPTWLQEPVFEWFSNQILNQFRLLSDWFWADICSLQEPLFIIFRSILDHFRLMSDRFWIDIYSILTWIGLMFTRCWDRFSSDLNKSILTLIATRIDK